MGQITGAIAKIINKEKKFNNSHLRTAHAGLEIKMASGFMIVLNVAIEMNDIKSQFL